MNKKRYFYGALSSIFSQIISVVCGILLPRVLIGVYGSELYGATTSITQFLGYIALLEGGIGGVARSALYRPLVDNDNYAISKIISYVEHFFRVIALIFVLYTLFLAFTYKYIVKDSSIDATLTFFLVIVIALSSLAQYYFGITYTVLLQADQRMFITNLLATGAMFVNTIISCILAFNGANIIVLKLSWCAIHVIRIIILNIYVRKKYNLIKVNITENLLPQKWDALGQHIAYFLHSHTDVVVLTMFVNLKEVAVYSIYHYIATSLNQIVGIVATNVEPIFGDLLARGDKKGTSEYFDGVDFMLNSMIMICYSVAFNLILPFVDLYAKGIEDANYHRLNFAILVLVAQMIVCIRIPYHQITVAAGLFKETRRAAYIEAFLNLGLSILFSINWGLEGIAFATIVSVMFRLLFYVAYLKNNIIERNINKFVKRIVVTVFGILFNTFIYNCFWDYIGTIDHFVIWIIWAIIFVAISIMTTIIFSKIFYSKKIHWMYNTFFRKTKVH